MKGPFAFRRMLEMEDYDHKREVAKLLDRIARLESQVRETEHQRDEAGQRYVQAVGDLHEAQGKIAELEAELAKCNDNRAEMFKEMGEDDETIIHLRECLRRVISGLAENVPIEVLQDAVVDARTVLEEIQCPEK